MIKGGSDGVGSDTLPGNGPHEHVLTGAPDAVRAGRRFVREVAARTGAEQLADDAALVAAELLANATQHGAPPVVVRVFSDGDGLRIEVRDGGSRLPVRPAPSTSNMTGRGLTLVTALTSTWGVDRDSAGKTVWALLRPESSAATGPDAQEDLDALLAQWADDDLDPPEQRYPVVLGDVPTDLLLEAKAHIDNLVREFSLAAATSDASTEAGAHLAGLVETVVHGFADARAAIKRQALAAAARGEARTHLTLRLPQSAADAGAAYLAALDDADEYARAARLLTLETPPEHRLFRRWYVQAVIDQLRAVAEEAAPPPIVPFERHLLDAVRQLSAMQRVTERAARLQRVTAALALARTPEDVAAAVVSDAVTTLRASGGALLVPAADGVHLAVPGTAGYAEHLVVQLRDERLDAPLPAASALRTGESVWIETPEEREARFPMLRGFEASTVAMCAVPLRVGERTIGVLRFSFDTRKLFDDDERAFVQALAAQTATTLLRTEVYAAEREAALEIQRALLPDVDDDVPGWDFAAHYSPAQDDEAGGDFYDVVPLAQLVTVLYVVFDPRDDLLRIANAGHLHPIVVDRTGSRVLPTTAGLPFGVQADDRPVLKVRLEPGQALLLITDGLVERRGADIDAGVDRVLAATAARGIDSGARALVARAIAATEDERARDDDVTALVLRRK